MQHAFDQAEEFVAHVKAYVNNRISAVKLQVAATLSKVVSNIIASAVVAAVMLVFAIFISMAGAFALSAWIGKMYAGFLIVSGIWLAFGLVIWYGREKLIRYPLMNKILHEMFEHEEDPEHT